MNTTVEPILETLLSLAAQRARSFCPSEVARLVAPQSWQELMPDVRDVAAHLVEEGLLVCTQSGHPVHPLLARGPIRLSRPR